MTAHRCPVCEGRKWMPPGFYSYMQALSSLEYEKCQTCEGTGLVWEPPTPPRIVRERPPLEIEA